MRSSKNVVKPGRISGATLNPELVLILLVVAIGRFLAFDVEAKLQVGLILILSVSALRWTYLPQVAAGGHGYYPVLGIFVIVMLTYRDSSYTRTASYAVFFLCLYMLSRAVSREVAHDSLIAGMGLYLFANVFGWAVGLDSPYAGYRLSGFETSSPFFGQRIFFPFSVSINETPYIAAAFLLAVLALARIGRQLRWHHWVGCCLAIFVLLGANNRATMLLVLASGLFIVAAPKLMRTMAPYVLLVALLFPFFVNFARPYIDLAASVLQTNAFLARGGTQTSLGTFEGRTVIWDGVIKFWFELASRRILDSPSIFFGYGFPGHARSGAYLNIPKTSSEFLLERTALHSHNSLLQVLLDAGIVGAGILIAVVVFLGYRYSRDEQLLPVLVILATAVASGVLESSLDPGMNYLQFYVLAFLAFFVPPRGVRDVAAKERDVTRSADGAGLIGLSGKAHFGHLRRK